MVRLMSSTRWTGVLPLLVLRITHAHHTTPHHSTPLMHHSCGAHRRAAAHAGADRPAQGRPLLLAAVRCARVRACCWRPVWRARARNPSRCSRVRWSPSLTLTGPQPCPAARSYTLGFHYKGIPYLEPGFATIAVLTPEMQAAHDQQQQQKAAQLLKAAQQQGAQGGPKGEAGPPTTGGGLVGVGAAAGAAARQQQQLQARQAAAQKGSQSPVVQAATFLVSFTSAVFSMVTSSNEPQPRAAEGEGGRGVCTQYGEGSHIRGLIMNRSSYVQDKNTGR